MENSILFRICEVLKKQGNNGSLNTTLQLDLLLYRKWSETSCIQTFKALSKQFSVCGSWPLWCPMPDTYITIQTIKKLQLYNSDKVILWLGVTTARRNVLKGCRIKKVENLCSKWKSTKDTRNVKKSLKELVSSTRKHLPSRYAHMGISPAFSDRPELLPLWAQEGALETAEPTGKKPQGPLSGCFKFSFPGCFHYLDFFFFFKKKKAEGTSKWRKCCWLKINKEQLKCFYAIK